MKFSSLATTVLAFGGLSVQAQYFSEGWAPGQAAQPSAEPEVVYTPGKPLQSRPQATQQTQAETPEQNAPRKSILEYLDPDKLLGLALDKMGFNVTAKMNESPWDDRIPLITDDNYQDLLENEEFASEQEEKDRVWAIVVTVSGSKTEPLSKLVDEMFDSAYNKSIEAGDLPNVRWGRIDYFKVTYLTTKWNVWKAPYLIIAKDRGRTLHFFQPGVIRIHDDSFREFLLSEGYLRLPPWSGVWAPGGEREWILDLFARYMTKGYNVFTKVPKWIMFMATGAIASVVLGFLHKPAKPSIINRTITASDAQKKVVSGSAPASPAPKGPSAAAAKAPESPSPSKKSAKQRKRKANA